MTNPMARIKERNVQGVGLTSDAKWLERSESDFRPGGNYFVFLADAVAEQTSHYRNINKVISLKYTIASSLKNKGLS